MKPGNDYLIAVSHTIAMWTATMIHDLQGSHTQNDGVAGCFICKTVVSRQIPTGNTAMVTN